MALNRNPKCEMCNSLGVKGDTVILKGIKYVNTCRVKKIEKEKKIKLQKNGN